jgi:nicotinamidase-related amidase
MVPALRGNPAPQPIKPGRTAIVVVDMQNDFCSVGGRADRQRRGVAHARQIIPRIAGLLDAARAAGCLVVYLQNTTLADGRLSSPADLLRRAAEWGEADPFPTREGTWGHAIVDELTPRPGDLVVCKLRQSGFVGTNLDLALRGHGRTTLAFAGVATHACVEATLRDALNRDYVTLLLRDGVAALEEHLHLAGLAVMKALLPRQWVMDSETFLGLVGGTERA